MVLLNNAAHNPKAIPAKMLYKMGNASNFGIISIA